MTLAVSSSAPTTTSTSRPNFERTRHLHRFLAQQAFYPLALCSLLAIAFLITRAILAGHLQYRFLVWNLFLAWVPYFFSLLALRMESWRKRQRAAKAFVWACWLAMFPNAPYIITDFVHMYEIRPLTWWYDLGMVLTFALSGVFLGIVSLRTMHDLIRPKFGSIIGWIFVTIVTTLSGFGIYLGRFRRFNSWDILTKPQVLFRDFYIGLSDPFANSRSWGVTLMFGAMMLVTYIMFVSTSRARTESSDQE